MNEGAPQGPNPEEIKRLEQEKLEKAIATGLAVHYDLHPKDLNPPQTLKETGPEIAEFEELVNSFHLKHSLKELLAIVDLSPDLAEKFKRADDLEDPRRIENDIRTYEKYNPAYIPAYKAKIEAARAIVLAPEDQVKFEMRRAAKKDLVPIVAKLGILKKEKNISAEKYGELNERYKNLAKALGNIQQNRVNH